MNTTNKKYWLRGGIILLAVFLIFLLSAMYLDNKYEGHPGLIIIPLLPAILVWGIFNIDLSGSKFLAIAIPLSSIFWVFVGAALGWLYGKIKNTKITN